mgnify:CR=1 FL=1
MIKIKDIILVFLWAFAFVFWLSGTFWLAYINSPDQFQRLGSFGIAVLAVLFGKLLYDLNNSYSRSTELEKKINNLTISNLGVQTQTLLKAMKIEHKLWGQYLRNEVMDDELRESISQDLGEIDGYVKEVLEMIEKTATTTEELVADISKTNNLIHRLIKHTGSVQIFLVVAATLQWGYGDLFVKYIHTF